MSPLTGWLEPVYGGAGGVPMPARLLMVSALLAAACALPATAADPESARPVDLARYAGT